MGTTRKLNRNFLLFPISLPTGPRDAKDALTDHGLFVQGEKGTAKRFKSFASMVSSIILFRTQHYILHCKIVTLKDQIKYVYLRVKQSLNHKNSNNLVIYILTLPSQQIFLGGEHQYLYGNTSFFFKPWLLHLLYQSKCGAPSLVRMHSFFFFYLRFVSKWLFIIGQNKTVLNKFDHYMECLRLN